MWWLNLAVPPALPIAKQGEAARDEVWCRNSTIVSALNLTNYLGVFWVEVYVEPPAQMLVGGHTECRIILRGMATVPQCSLVSHVSHGTLHGWWAGVQVALRLSPIVMHAQGWNRHRVAEKIIYSAI